MYHMYDCMVYRPLFTKNVESAPPAPVTPRSESMLVVDCDVRLYITGYLFAEFNHQFEFAVNDQGFAYGDYVLTVEIHITMNIVRGLLAVTELLFRSWPDSRLHPILLFNDMVEHTEVPGAFSERFGYVEDVSDRDDFESQ
jgi:hypothetical protein